VLLNEGASADLAVTKTDSADPVLNGQQFTYTLKVTNVGPDAATGISIVDEVPEGASFVSAPDACEENAGTVTCHVGDLPNADDAATDAIVENEQIFAVTLQAVVVGTLTSTASVDGLEGDPVPGNDSDTESTVVVAAADLSVSAQKNFTTAQRGQELSYTFTVSNQGPDSAEGVALGSVLPDEMTFVSSPDGCLEEAGEVTCSIGTLAVDGSALRTIVLRAGETGTLSQQVTVASATGDVDTADRAVSVATGVVDTIAPAVTLVSPADTSSSADTTPTFGGAAGGAIGDAHAVTVRIYSGHAASAEDLPDTALQARTATPAGDGAYSVDAAPLAPGGYTARAEQADDVPNTGHSALVRFTILPPPDGDGDGVPDSGDNCPTQSNGAQTDTDADGAGNACDTDDDGDGVPDASDAFPLNAGESKDADKDGTGDGADADDDNDGVSDTAEQTLGTDPLKPDTDGDGKADGADKCPKQASPAADGCPVQSPVETPAVDVVTPEETLASLKAQVDKLRDAFGSLGLARLSDRGYKRSAAGDQAGLLSEELLAPRSATKGKKAQGSAAAKNVVIAKGTATFTAAGSKTIQVKPTRSSKKARKVLRKAKSVKLTVRTTFKPASGAPAIVASTKLTVKKG
jgi:uncharacterized repeat protein (TIGR01451 family)